MGLFPWEVFSQLAAFVMWRVKPGHVGISVCRRWQVVLNTQLSDR